MPSVSWLSAVRLFSLSLVFLPFFCVAQSLNAGFSLGSSGSDFPAASVLNSAGDLYVTGYFSGSIDMDPGIGSSTLTSNGSGDVFLAKYDKNGALLWAISMGGTGFDQAMDVGLDAGGNVYIGGRFENTMDADPGVSTTTLSSNGSADAFLARFKADGSFLWAVSFGGTGLDEITSIAPFDLDHVYVGGRFLGTIDIDPSANVNNLVSNGGYDLFFAQFSPAGSFNWGNHIGGSTNDGLSDLETDATSNLYLTGGYVGTVDFDPSANTANLTPAFTADVYLAKYDKLGNYQWAFSFGGAGFFGSEGIALDTDASGIYLTGILAGTADLDPSANTASFSSTGFQSGFVAKYDFNSTYQWAFLMSASGFDYVRPEDICLDDDGNLLVAGGFTGVADFDPSAGTSLQTSAGNQDSFVGKYTTGGVFQWAFRLGNAASDYATSVSADRNQVFSTGLFSSIIDLDPNTGTTNLTSAGGTDIWLGQYTPLPFPVEWAYFSATEQVDQVLLEWGTEQEIATDFYVIERSGDGQIFQALDKLSAAGNSTELQTYQFFDTQPLNGLSHYRLRQVDIDGRFAYSKTQSITVRNHFPSLSLFPNPAQTRLNLRFSGLNADLHQVEIEIINALGMRVFQLWIDPASPQDLFLPSLPAGIYTVQAEIGETRIAQRLVLQGS